MVGAIRKAAAVIAAREGPDGPEVLVLQRSVASRFLPGYVAFPGGAADRDDVGLAERWFGAADEAARACGVRELLEEVGLALTGSGLRRAPHGDVHLVTDDPPRAEQLSEIAHWVAPETVPVRFDARYFAVEAGPDVEPEADGAEVTAAWWASPRSILEAWRDGRRKLYWPTYFTMDKLAACGSVEELLALRFETREPHEGDLAELPRSTFWEDGEG
jgi:8-oxo-dGTP pyrophosphatase MutT (NUDIX family)